MSRNFVIIAGRRTCVCHLSSVVQASRERRGLLVLIAGFFLVAKSVGARRMRQSHKADAPEHVTAGAGSASLSATSAVVSPAAAAGGSSARLFLGAGAFLTLVHGGTRRCASPFCLPIFCMLRQASQKGASDAPDAVAALAAFIDAARGVLWDNGIRYST